LRKLSDLEMLSFRELLQSETNGLLKSKMVQPSVNDPDLKKHVITSITSCEERIKGYQQFINENQVINPSEVH
jgi:hypothetical protein